MEAFLAAVEATAAAQWLGALACGRLIAFAID
jgi:hypothetical protein